MSTPGASGQDLREPPAPQQTRAATAPQRSPDPVPAERIAAPAEARLLAPSPLRSAICFGSGGAAGVRAAPIRGLRTPGASLLRFELVPPPRPQASAVLSEHQTVRGERHHPTPQKTRGTPRTQKPNGEVFWGREPTQSPHAWGRAKKAKALQPKPWKTSSCCLGRAQTPPAGT